MHQTTYQELLATITAFKECPNQRNLPTLLSQLQSCPIQDSAQEEKVVASLLQLPPSFRTPQICERLESWLSQLDYFTRVGDLYGEKAMQLLCTYLTAEYHSPGRRLIKVGDESSLFYVILRGQVMVLYVRENKDVERDNMTIDRQALRGLSKLQRVKLRETKGKTYRGLAPELIEGYEIFFNSYGVPLYDVENMLISGQSFGELGIIYKQKRLAHVICRSDCLVATLTSDKYMRLIAEKESGAISNMMEFLSQHFYSGLGKLEMKQAQRYLYLFNTIDKKINSVICSAGAPILGLYMVLEGSLLIRSQSRQEQRKPNEKSVCSIIRSAWQKSQRKFQQYRTLYIGQTVGLEEIVLRAAGKSFSDTFSYTAVTAENSKLLFCPLQKVQKLLKTDRQLLQELLERIQCRKKLKQIQFKSAGRIRKNGNRQRHPLQFSKEFPKRHEIRAVSRRMETIRSAGSIGSRCRNLTEQSPRKKNDFSCWASFVNVNSKVSRPMSSQPSEHFRKAEDQSHVLTTALLSRMKENTQPDDRFETEQRAYSSHSKLRRFCRTAKTNQNLRA